MISTSLTVIVYLWKWTFFKRFISSIVITNPPPPPPHSTSPGLSICQVSSWWGTCVTAIWREPQWDPAKLPSLRGKSRVAITSPTLRRPGKRRNASKHLKPVAKRTTLKVVFWRLCRSVGLLMQVSLPCALFAQGPSELCLKGGTNAEMAPQIDYTMKVWISFSKSTFSLRKLTTEMSRFS